MTRRTRYGILSLLMLLMATGAAFVWLLGTAGGARWLIETALRRASVRTEIAHMEGSVWRGLRLEGTRLQWPSGHAEIGNVFFRWQPWSLLEGRIAAKKLSFGDVVVQDNRPETGEAPDLSWPRVSGLAAVLKVSIKTLQVEEFSYRRPDKSPLRIRSFSGSADLREGRLAVGSLSLDTVFLEAEGQLYAGFVKPFVNLDLEVRLAEPALNFSRFSVKAALGDATLPEQVAGPMTIEGIAASGKSTELSAVVGLTRSSLGMRKIRVTEKSRHGEIHGRGEILFTAEEPFLRFALSAYHLDLAPELAAGTDISGTLEIEGTFMTYKGHFALTNRDGEMKSAAVSGSVEGNREGMRLNDLNGSWLGGTVEGEIGMRWREGILIKGDLRGRGLEPSRISPDWTGVINLDLRGSLLRAEGAPTRGELGGRLLHSRLRGRELKGEVEASLRDDTLIISNLALHGRGFDVTASGDLRRRISFSASVGDLSGLIPGTEGQLRAGGWVRLREGRLAVAASGSGRNLSAKGTDVEAAGFELKVDDGRDGSVGLRTDLKGIAYGRLRLGSLSLNLDGTARNHTLVVDIHSPGTRIDAALSGSYLESIWKGKITRLSGRDTVGPWGLESPADLFLSGEDFSLSSVLLRGEGDEGLELTVEVSRRPLAGFLRLRWNGLNLARADQWLTDIYLSGKSSGDMEARWSGGDLRAVAGQVDVSGTIKAEKYLIEIRRGSINLSWSEKGLVASVDLDSAEGMLRGRLSSPDPVRMALPGQGEIEAEWRRIDLALLRPWLPPDMELKGRAFGRVEGKLLPGRRLDLVGSGSIAEGLITVKKGKREFSAALREARLSADWRDQALSCEAGLTLADYGYLRLNLQVPLPALIPSSINPEGPLFLSAEGKFRESGLLSSFFPGLIEESSGELDLLLKIEGKWSRPVTAGTLEFSRAGAYLPAAGIHLKEAGFTARLEGDLITVDSFHAKSGPGSIEGRVTVKLRDRRVIEYNGNIKGNRFQFVHLPHLQVLGSPDLEFEGAPKKLAVHGEIALPELVATESGERPPVAPSEDVIIVDAPRPAEREPFALDLKVSVKLGDKVLVKAEGFDVQLGGSVDLAATGLRDVRGTGVLNVVKGKYSAYGVSLDVTRGRVVFGGGPAERPALDILAVRKVEEVTAGVLISGTPASPVVQLYSRPPIPDSDIMSYIVLGHRLGDDSKEVSLVMRAAGVLLSKSDSVVLQDQIKRRVGLDTLDIVSGEGEVSRSMVTAGKYLTPNLYISYGRSLFTDASLVKLRYKLSKRWEIETQSGAETGADLFYKIEFR